MADNKVDVEHASIRQSSEQKASGSGDSGANAPLGEPSGGLVPPEIVRAMTPEYRASLEKRLKKKIDLRLLPTIVIMYILNYIDRCVPPATLNLNLSIAAQAYPPRPSNRNNIAAAALAGLKDDLNLTGSQFPTAVSILFVGYLLMQVPSNLLLNKMGKPALYLPAAMVIWGVISAATAGVHTYGGLLAVRFFLGFVEAVYFPGCLYYLSCWYTRSELGLRTTLLYSGALISGAFSGLISAGITGNMDGLRGWRAWRWLFLIEGVITVAIAIGAFFVLPNLPRTTSWLDEEEKALAAWRLEEDVGQDDWVSSEDQSLWTGFRQALQDVKTWILLVLVFGIVASGSITNFFPTVVKTLKFGNVETLLLTSPPYVLCCIVTLLNAWHADRTGERYFHIVLPLSLAVVAFIIAASTTGVAPRYVSMMLMLSGIYSGYTTALAWISNTLPRPPAKRAAALAFINAVSNCSSIYASYLYGDSMAPRYIAAFAHNCAGCFVAICAATVLRFMLVRLNKKLEMGEHVKGAINAVPGEASQHGFRFRV
ncbi:related to nicotinamide mononucleotide permease [Cephalotrichum gorgonifer]|uniref:Related to nicotinamide mononucleotide permease n=1 Tax=Cephalotrichum gorgonifer TaxID=2041049 RepID=A0AAE8SZA0_9PEZI|nr:related to nicotinamide mononucleotide permease [Cephalotrichum gorgonifer]